jgi:hypothetical protein
MCWACGDNTHDSDVAPPIPMKEDVWLAKAAHRLGRVYQMLREKPL